MLIYILGLLIGVAAFLYLLSLYHAGKDRLAGKGRPPKADAAPDGNGSRINADAVRFPGLDKIPPGTRLCPLCRRELQRFEPLYASQVEYGGEVKILIYGCGYCHKGRENGRQS